MIWYNKVAWSHYSDIPYLAEFGTLTHYIISTFSLGFLLPVSFASKPDTEVLSDPIYRKRLMESKREVFRHGIRGAALELKLYTSDWGFDISKISSKVYLFYGEEDRSVPLAMGMYYKSQIKNSVLKTYPGEGHLLSVRHMDEILQTLRL